ncbi:MAG TPA: AsmA-like C-terminal region-containing protein [Verrucomicrobiae bacterium]|nr:AsmA-like C-terminal region-containing protein [Verrucomicrobiae bacterium]
MGDKTHFWTKWRTRFRICRICVWLLILALVCVVLWLNQIGLPDFVKRPLVDGLRQHGIALEFVRLRLNFIRGLVADNVRIGGELTNSPSLSLQELQLQINYRALLHRKLQLDGVVLRKGKFILPISASNEPPCALTFDNIQSELRFETNDVWTLDNLQASFAGADFILSGQVANASAISNWGMLHGKQGLRGATQSQLKKIGTTLSKIHLNKNSQLSLNVHGDARHINSFFVFLTVNAPGAQTPWGSAENLTLVARSTVPVQRSGEAVAPPLEIDWKAQLGSLKTGVADADYVYCAGSWHATGEIDWKTEVARLQSERLDADFISCAGNWRAPEVEITNLYARLGEGQLHAAAKLNATTREFYFTNSSCFNLQAIAKLLPDKAREQLDQIRLPQPPELQAAGSLILPPWTNGMSDLWSADIQPSVRINGYLAVTNPTISGISLNEGHASFAFSNEVLNGELVVTDPTIRGFSLHEAYASFTYSHAMWTVPEALLTRTSTRLQIQGYENDTTKEYQCRVQGSISSDVVPPFLDAKGKREFQHYSFDRPLFLNAQIRGRLNDYDSISAEGHAALTNFVVRGEPVDSAAADFHYAHMVIDLLHPRVEAGVQRMHADEVKVDWPGDRIYFINGRGVAYPQAVGKAIGPLQEQVMKPYHFLAPADTIVNGYAPLRDANPANADLDFKSAGPVQVEILNVRSHALTGELHWIGKTLILTNLAASLYGGTGTGNIDFDFRPRLGANFTFVSDFHDVDLHGLALDLSTPSNHLEHLEGLVSGHFVETSGYSEDWRSCNGYGQVNMHNGLLWDVPAFGALSPALNFVTPGLGNSRATDASAQFFMTNGVIATDNLQIHTMLMLLQCKGTLDLKGRLDAHFTAQLLHDFRYIGPLLAIVTVPVGKICECKVTGTWNSPKSRLLYLNGPQKLILDVLHPFHALENQEINKSRENMQQPQSQ